MSGLAKAALGIFTGGAPSWVPLAIVAALGAGIAGGVVWWVKDVEVGHVQNEADAAANRAQDAADKLKIETARADDLAEQTKRQAAMMVTYQNDIAGMRTAAQDAQAKTDNLSRSYATAIKELKDARKNAVAVSPDVRNLLPYLWCMQQHRGDTATCAGSAAPGG